MLKAASQSTTRRALLGAAAALPAIAAATAAGAAPAALPAFTDELGERYLFWLHLEQLNMWHHLGITPGWTPVDRMVPIPEPGQAAARAAQMLATSGVSVQPDLDSLRRRLSLPEPERVRRADYVEQLKLWERRRAHFWREANKRGLSDERLARLCDIADGYEERIRRAPCDSRTAAFLKLQIAQRDAAVGERLTTSIGADDLIGQAMDYLRGVV